MKRIIKQAIVLVLIFFFYGWSSAQNNENQVLKTIFQRKSVRHFTGQKVSMDTLVLLAKAGMASPTAMNQQPWEFILITRPSLLDSIQDGLPYAKMLSKAGACIIVCGNTHKSMLGMPEDFWIQDCSAASENILLAAESMGIGAGWTSVYPGKDRISHVRKTLKLPDFIIPLNAISVGFPSGEDKPKDKFKPDNIHKNGWK